MRLLQKFSLLFTALISCKMWNAIYVCLGYGQTEATAAITISVPGDYYSGSVGTPALCNVVKLVDVPEQNYYADQGKGEVCAKGTNIFIGYYKDKVKTAEALDEDGWLHTGDIGTWLPVRLFSWNFPAKRSIPCLLA